MLTAVELGPDDISARWRSWSESWHLELETLITRCRLRTSKAMAPLAQAARDLKRLGFAYTTALKGFTEVGRRPIARFRDRHRAAAHPGGPTSAP